MDGSRKHYTDRSFCIVNERTGEQIRIAPIAIEKCMSPGEFTILPVEVIEQEVYCIYRSGEQQVTVEEAQCRKGIIQVKEIPFVPQVRRHTKGCRPCTNCGRC